MIFSISAWLRGQIVIMSKLSLMKTEKLTPFQKELSLSLSSPSLFLKSMKFQFKSLSLNFARSQDKKLHKASTILSPTLMLGLARKT
jgi:hypothetical protein